MVCYERKRKNSHFLNLWDSKQWARDNAVEGNESERECDKSWVFFFPFQIVFYVSTEMVVHMHQKG